MHRDTGTGRSTSECVRSCQGCGGDISNTPAAEFCGEGCQDITVAADQNGFGVWTEAFTELTGLGGPDARGPTMSAGTSRAVAGLVDGAEGWRELGLCQQVDPELFFPEPTRPSTADAKRVCAACPVRAQCLAAALERRESYGVWGGTTPNERARLRARTQSDSSRRGAATRPGIQPKWSEAEGVGPVTVGVRH